MKMKQLLTRTAGALGVTAGLLFVGSPLMAQVKIGDNPNTINPSSILELESATKGLLQPRVELQATNVAAPLTGTVPEGMRVYNTATTSGDYGVSPGEYYYDGTNWVKLITEVGGGVEVYREGAPTVGGTCGADPERTIWNDISETATGQQWICRNGVWEVYDAPASRTPFNFRRLTDNKEVDAGARKSGNVYRYGQITSRLPIDGGSSTLLPGGGIQLLRRLDIAPKLGAFVNFGRNAGTPDYFSIGLYNDLNAGDGAMVFGTNSPGKTSQDRMVIGHNGQVGINTSNPLRILHVDGAALFSNNGSNGDDFANGTAPQNGILLNWIGTGAAANSAQIAVQTPGTNIALSKRLQANGGEIFIGFNANGSVLGDIRYTVGGDIAISQTSDRRLKENIKDTHYSIEDLMKIGVVDYNYKTSAAKTRTVGFIAQDLYEVYPEAVSKGGEDAKTNPWTVNYSKLTPLLVKAVQDQQKEIAALKAKLSEMNALKAEVASIKAMLDNAAQQKSEATISK